MKDIDKIFQKAHQASENQSFSSFEKVWDKLEERLEAETPSKKTIPMWKIMGVVASVALVLGIAGFLLKPTTQVVQKSTIEAKSPTPAVVATTTTKKHENTQQAAVVSDETADIPPLPKNPIAMASQEMLIPQIAEGGAAYASLSDPDGLDDETVSAEAVDSQKDSKTVAEIALKTEEKQAMENMSAKVGYLAMQKESMVEANREPKAEQMLQGRLAGLKIAKTDKDTLNNDVANSSATKLSELASGVKIRGINSLDEKEKPLYIVDGKEVDAIDMIKPEDIAKMEVLKDSAAVAIYGAKASKGVIIITTKNAKNAKELRKEQKRKKKDSIDVKK